MRFSVPSFRRPIKLDQFGFDHVLVPVLVVVVVAVVGTAFIIQSHAQSVSWTGRIEVGQSNSGECLTTTGGGTGSTAYLTTCSSSYNTKQIWSVVNTRTINIAAEASGGGTASGVQEFMLQSAAGSNECLNDWQSSSTNYTQTRLYTCNSNQAANDWTWESKVGNASSHQLMNLAASHISATGSRSKGSSGWPANVCLDYHYLASNHPAVIYACDGANYSPTPVWQYWFEDSAPAKSNTGGGTSATWSGALQNGYNRKYCMNDNNSSVSNRSPIGIYTCGNYVSEKWTITKSNDGTFLLRNGQGVCADDTGVYTQTNLINWNCNSADHAQLWHWVGHQIQNVYSKSCINDPGSSTKNGTQLTVTSCNGAPASEQWIEAAL